MKCVQGEKSGNGGKIIDESGAVTNVFVFLIQGKDNFCV